jgi:amino acid adenylation domain-containing protein
MSVQANESATVSKDDKVAVEHHVGPTNPFIKFKKEEIEQSIPDRFEQIARSHAHKVAVKTRQHALTYSEANQTANRVARAILAQRGSEEEPIALLLENDVHVFAAILGVLKAGKIYVPLEPAYPQARNSFMLQDSQARLIVTNNKNLALAEELSSSALPVINIDELGSSFSSDNLDLSVSPDATAYILYTSGSSGQPKGVMQNHRNVLQQAMIHTNSLHISDQDRQTLMQSCSFTRSIKEMYGALLNGATLFPYAWDEGLAGVQDWLLQEEITIYGSVVTTFRTLVDTLAGEEQFPNLRLIYLGGGHLYRRDVEKFQELFAPHCLLVHGMGSTEAGTVIRSFIDMQTKITDSVVPVDQILEDMEVLILDDSGKPLGPEHTGEIAVRSPYLALGYWRRPELTKAAFRPDPEGSETRIYLTGDLGRIRRDGSLEIVGRKDSQVKVRGFRVELGAVESALQDLESVKETAVIAQPTVGEDNRLIAYLTPAVQPPPTADALRNALGEKLPDHMVPSTFVVMAEMPRTPTGKIDRRSLPAPGYARPALASEYVAPDTDRQRTLAEIWSQVLGVNQVGVHDSFFDLGGNSLLAMRLFSQIEEEFGISCSITSFLATPTIEQLDHIIEEESSAPGVAAGVVDSRVETQEDKGPGWKRFTRKVLQVLALYAPMSFRTWLHRTRGVKLGEGVWIGAGVIIDGAYPQLVSIGDNVAMSVRCTIIAHFRTPPADALAGNKPLLRIEDDVYLGPGTIILPNVTIGRGAVVSAGSVVSQSIPPMTMVQGNPARPVARCGVPLRGHTYEEFLRKLEPIEE